MLIPIFIKFFYEFKTHLSNSKTTLIHTFPNFYVFVVFNCYLQLGLGFLEGGGYISTTSFTYLFKYTGSVLNGTKVPLPFVSSSFTSYDQKLTLNSETLFALYCVMTNNIRFVGGQCCLFLASHRGQSWRPFIIGPKQSQTKPVWTVDSLLFPIKKSLTKGPWTQRSGKTLAALRRLKNQVIFSENMYFTPHAGVSFVELWDVDLAWVGCLVFFWSYLI